MGVDDLPEPDQFGNYWLTDRKRNPCWAIFRSKTIEKGQVVPQGWWILLAGEQGVVYDHGWMRRFLSPGAALRRAVEMGFKG